MQENKMSRSSYNLILLDGNNLIFRAFWANPKLSTRINGKVVRTGLIYGSFVMLLRIQRQFPRVPIVWVWDSGNDRRKKIDSSYKAHRDKSDPIFEEIFRQKDDFRKILRFSRVAQVWKKGEEADDVIATLARKTLGKKLIVSTDHDLLQLIRNNVHILMKDFQVWGPDEVRKKWHIESNKLVDVFTLAGCRSDNIAGVRGIGFKTAIDIVKSYPNFVQAVINGQAFHKDFNSTPKFFRNRLLESKSVIQKSFKLSKVEDGLIDIEKREGECNFERFWKSVLYLKFHSLLDRESEVQDLCKNPK